MPDGIIPSLSAAIDSTKRTLQQRLADLISNPGEYLSMKASSVKENADALNRMALAAALGDRDAKDNLNAWAMNVATNGIGAGITKGASGTLLSDAERAAKMDAMKMERGWYRGGSQIGEDGRRSGPMYTQNPEEASAYMSGYEKRTGKPGDVREYAIPSGPYLNADKSYPPRLAHDVANLIDTPYYGKEGQYLANQLRTYGPDERIVGGDLWQALESRFGNDGAAETIAKLGAFKGAKGFTAPGEAYVFPSSPVRDANLAAFDPANKGLDNIYGFATLPAITGGAGLGLLGLEALRRTQRVE